MLSSSRKSLQGLLTNLRIFEGEDNITLIGIRFESTKPNEFKDLIGCCINNHVVLFDGTTSPGTYWLNNPMRVTGTARLMPGFYKACWVKGTHKGKEALVQSSKARFLVERDGDKDSDFDSNGVVHTDAAGINLHRAGERSTKVDKWSAGCQVIANTFDFENLLSIIDKDKVSTTFSYQLFMYGDRDEFIKALGSSQ